LYSKNFDLNTFNKRTVSNYFSASISLNNNNDNSLKFFNSSKVLKESHQLYLKKYLFSLVLNEKISLAINEIRQVNEKNFLDFFDAQLLLALDSIKKKKIIKKLFFIQVN
tara:strand:+ start:127 stop:456 length:330 start_codon:yes stop_codon:yes gene_type:complete